MYMNMYDNLSSIVYSLYLPSDILYISLKFIPPTSTGVTVPL